MTPVAVDGLALDVARQHVRLPNTLKTYEQVKDLKGTELNKLCTELKVDPKYGKKAMVNQYACAWVRVQLGNV